MTFTAISDTLSDNFFTIILLTTISDIEIPIDSGMGLSITIDKLRVFINKTLSILSAYQ